MKRIVTCLLMVCMVFTACSSVNGGDLSENALLPPAATDNNPSGESLLSQFTDGNVQIVSARAGLYSSHYANSGSGEYEIFAQPSGDKNIIYHDFETRKTVYLSSQANAHFTDKSDPSHLEPCITTVKPIVVDDKLYIFRTNAPLWIEKNGEEAQGYLYECNLDGSNRRLVYKFDEKEYLGGCAIACDGDNFYYLATILDEDLDGMGTHIFRLSIATGERTILCSLEPSRRHWIIDAGGSSIVLKSIANPIQYGDEQINEDAYNNQEHIFTIVSIKTGEMREVTSWKQDEKIETSYNGSLIYIDRSDNTIKRQNLFNGEIVTLGAVPIELDGNSFEFYTMYPDIRDNHIFFSGGYYITEDNVDVPKSFLYACDLSTGETQPITYIIDDSYINIYGENEDYFFTTIGRKEFPITDYFDTGEAYVTDLIVELPALVLKDDYFAGNIEYLEFEDLVYVD